jgi:cyclic beta-1,2-glucan synthetase
MSDQLPVRDSNTQVEQTTEEIEAGTLNENARGLASEHRVGVQVPQSYSIYNLLKQQSAFLDEAHREFQASTDEDISSSYAGEWILDNYYVIRRTFRQITDDLPQNYYRQLPKLINTRSAGLPRIYAIAADVIVLNDASLDMDYTENYIQSFQQIAPLNIGELWAVPTMLRLGFIEALVLAVAKILHKDAPISTADAQIKKLDLEPDTLIAHCITSLRTIENYEWKDFFDRLSLVEQVLLNDPAGIYGQMDFDSRDRYRIVIENTALLVEQREIDVAQAVVAHADESQYIGKRQQHVGYWLIDEGYHELQLKLGYSPKWLERIGNWLRRHPAVTYTGGILLLTVSIVLFWYNYALTQGANIITLIGVVLLTAVPALTISTAFFNWLLTRFRKPNTLPKLDFSKTIPEDCRTIVVIPALISSLKDIDNLIRQIEIHYLQNGGANIHFGLLTDFADADAQHRPEDQGLIQAAIERVNELNQKYAGLEESSFFFFHRERRLNDSMKTWMGWERKRGKLEEFTRLILEKEQTSFIASIGPLQILPSIKYVITLDADTVLTRGSARSLIGCMAHPLNRPVFDSETGQVTHGYTILQPRTEIRPISANYSWFSRIYAGDTGLDLYSRAVSDIYQDWFGEGIYVGKGIFDVAAFSRALEGKVPENTLLSHDLFEGIMGRAGLVTDIVLYEDYPPTYLSYINRLHRWIRGDWQLLPWLIKWTVDLSSRSTPVKFIDTWKIIDNLFRSLLPPALLLLLVSAWLWLPGGVTWWMAFALLAPAVPIFTNVLNSVFSANQENYFVDILQNVKIQFLRWLFAIIFLPFEALVAADAILVTLTRVYITRRNLLQWMSAAKSAVLSLGLKTVSNIWAEMIQSVLLVILLTVLVILFAPILSIFFLLILWGISPLVAYQISQPVTKKKHVLSKTEIEIIKRLARRTWLFFERFVGPEDHWLPPDHYQESPLGQIAHRTSPTNIGLLLTSTLGARDFGYISLEELVLRIHNSFSTLKQMEKYRGHLLNWYDTRTLDPLLPRYVSTVDSGNFIGSLISLKQGFIELLRTPILNWKRWTGLIDILDILFEITQPLLKAAPETSKEIHGELSHIHQLILEVENSPDQWTKLVRKLRNENLIALEQAFLTLVEADPPGVDVSTFQSMRLWSDRLRYHLQYLEMEYTTFTPWLFMLQDPPSILANPDKYLPIEEKWRSLVLGFPQAIYLENIPGAIKTGFERLAELQSAVDGTDAPAELIEESQQWCRAFKEKLANAEDSAAEIIKDISEIIELCENWIIETDFGFLFNPKRQIFRIGYNVTTGNRDQNYYDLLASEARIASMIAIGKREIPQSHWLHLGRPLTIVGNLRAVLSWSGTMFEYLMPLLHTRQYENTLLSESCYAAVKRQIRYAQDNGVPWGVSESGYYRFDAQDQYQYRAFGVPGLGLKRGLEEDLVITPYASILALSIDAKSVMENIEKLISLDLLRDYGFYEAIDFTTRRLPLGQEKGVIRSFMAHHQGMILLSIANYLDSNSMVERFHSDARIQSADLLLQEKVPALAPIQLRSEEETQATPPVQSNLRIEPWSVPSQTPHPQALYLSNGQFGSLITNNGGGFLRWEELDLTRWRADSTLDPYGLKIYFYEQDVDETWCIAGQPSGSFVETDHINFSPNRAELLRSVNDIVTDTEIIVSPDDNIEIRQIRLTNRSGRPRSIKVASYAEVILAPQSDDRRHPVFNTLFIESEYEESIQGLHFTRRKRSPEEKSIHLVHALFISDGHNDAVIYETDRNVFLGRGGDYISPPGLHKSDHGNTGSVLHPVMSLGKVIHLPPQGTVRLAFLTSAAATRNRAISIVRRYQDWPIIQRAFDRAQNASEIEMRRMDLSQVALKNIQQLLSLLIYPQPTLRAGSELLSSNRMGQTTLWPYAISGDFPILLARIKSEDEIPLVAELLNAHAYWRSRNIKIDLVILNEKETSYSQEIKGQINRLITNTQSDAWLNQRGGIFILQTDQINEEDLVMILSAARAILDGSSGAVDTQLRDIFEMPTRLPDLLAIESDETEETTPVKRPTGLLFDNGHGGFTPDGKEYQIFLQPGQLAPAPWSNVIANDQVGFLITERGGGYSWSKNSGENRLSPWSNDPVIDPPGEAIYLRDEETARVWSPAPFVPGADSPYLVRHGAGYTIFEHNRYGLEQELRLFVAPDTPVKFAHLKIHNTWQRPRRITVTYYLEWVLGVNRDEMQQYIILDHASESGALLARNPYNPEFGERVAFLAVNKPVHGLTANRSEFLGRKGSYQYPAALKRIGLSGRVETGVDPCAVLQVHLDLQPGAAEEVFFIIGQGENQNKAIHLIDQNRLTGRAAEAWQQMIEFWEQTLETIQVETPDNGMNLILNRWLLYQNLSCRIWGRSAFYQSSGAYGFRDQLQDTMAMIHALPQVAREHILRAAHHQFEEGDVLHWWHPPSGRGVRTRITDDLLWLPYVVAEYVSTTGDESILREEVPFLRGKPLERGEEERYNLWETTREAYPILEHCQRAIRKGSTRGRHDLPLIGAGDWNDGMNRVGIKGRGESVWLGWFLSSTLSAFADILDRVGEREKAGQYRQEAQELVQAINTHAWDGNWYLRGYYDDGSPLGASGNMECKIDAIAQSWSLLSQNSHGGNPRRAIESVWENLVREEDQLVLLFTPPFDSSPHDPGYIKGYPPGIRENGGQYTHAATWTVWAFTKLGDGDRPGIYST